MYLSASVPLTEAISSIKTQCVSKSERATISGWLDMVEEGQSLSRAISGSRIAIVSAATISNIRLGEETGELARVIKNRSEQIKEEILLRKKVVGALIYPGIIFLGTLVLVTCLLVFVFPKIVPIFKTLKTDLPVSTRLLIFVSQALIENWLEIILTLVSVIASIAVVFRSSKKARDLFEQLLFRVPVLGKIVKSNIQCSIFSYLHLLTNNGGQIEESLKTVSEITKSSSYKKLLVDHYEEISAGKKLSELISQNPKHYSVFVPSIISVGESTGNLSGSFKDLAQVLREDLDGKLKFFTTALEPVLMITMSLIVGFVAISIILPIYGITSNFQNV